LFSALCLTLCPPPSSTLFPYTTLFRSLGSLRRPAALRRGRRLLLLALLSLPARAHHRYLLRLERRQVTAYEDVDLLEHPDELLRDRKSTRLNSSHQIISYAVFCLKKKN